MKRILLVSLLFLCGCEFHGPVIHTGAGWVRASFNNEATVIFETEANGHLIRATFCNGYEPPVWKGWHGELVIQHITVGDADCYETLDSIHLPPDLQ